MIKSRAPRVTLPFRFLCVCINYDHRNERKTKEFIICRTKIYRNYMQKNEGCKVFFFSLRKNWKLARIEIYMLKGLNDKTSKNFLLKIKGAAWHKASLNRIKVVSLSFLLFHTKSQAWNLKRQVENKHASKKRRRNSVKLLWAEEIMFNV